MLKGNSFNGRDQIANCAQPPTLAWYQGENNFAGSETGTNNKKANRRHRMHLRTEKGKAAVADRGNDTAGRLGKIQMQN